MPKEVMQKIMSNKPHVHAEIIKQWADGEEIQCRASAFAEWVDVICPSWDNEFEYRVKPSYVAYRLYLYRPASGENDLTVQVWNMGNPSSPEVYHGFIRWLGNIQKVEV